MGPALAAGGKSPAVGGTVTPAGASDFGVNCSDPSAALVKMPTSAALDPKLRVWKRETFHVTVPPTGTETSFGANWAAKALKVLGSNTPSLTVVPLTVALEVTRDCTFAA